MEFVNRLARRAGEKYPGVVIRTFAYVSSDVPPKGGIVPEPNVIIWYCDLYSKCDDMLPLTHPFNSRSLGLLREWSALTDAAANRIEGRRSCRICASASAADAGAAGVMGDGGGKQERTSGESRGRKHYTSHGARGGSAATDRHDLLPQEGKL